MILVLTDFSKRALRAAELALELAITSKKSIVLYHSIVLPGADLEFGSRLFSEEDVVKRKDESLQKMEAIADHLTALKKKMGGAEINIILKTGTGAVSDSIIYLVREYDVWMVVMGYRIAELKNLLVENNVSPVTNNAGCPVLLVP